jgi:hypothetical protein
MAENQQEKRRDLRVVFRSTARLRFSGERVYEKCETSDISVSGVFVRGVSGVVGGESCEIEFRLIGHTSSLVLELAGEVVRVVDGGVALQFIEVDQDSFCHLQNIVYFNYKEAGQLGVPAGEMVSEVEDETVYLGLDGSRSNKPLPDNYLSCGDGDEDGDDHDLDGIGRAGYGPGPDD